MNRCLGLNLIFIIFTIIIVETHQSAFPVGHQYSYDFSNNVFIKDFYNGKPIAYRTTGVLKVANILDGEDSKLLKFSFETPKLNVRPHGSDSQTEFQFHKSPLDNYANSEFYSIWKNGHISDVYVKNDETDALINVKKSLVSLFQFQTKDGDYNEIRSSGACKVTYREISPNQIQRLEQHCEHTQKFVDYFVRPEKPLTISNQNHRITDYKFAQDGPIERIDSRDYFHIGLELNQNIGASIDSVIVLENNAKPVKIAAAKEKSPKEFLSKLSGSYKGLNIESVRLIPNEKTEKKKLKTLVKNNAKALATDKYGTIESAKAFLDVLLAAEYTEKDDIVQVLEWRRNVEIKPQLLDIMGATQTKNSYDAVVEAIDFLDDAEADNVERYLQALAVATRPNAIIMSNLLEFLDDGTFVQNDKIRTTIIHTLGAMAYRYAHLPGQSYSSRIVEQVSNMLNSSIAACDEDDSACLVLYLNGINNLRSAAMIDLLLTYADHSERAVALAAMKALCRLSSSVWDRNSLKRIENIFYQRKQRYDSSLRFLAIDIMFESDEESLTNDAEKLKQLLNYMRSDDPSYELKRYLFERLIMLSEESLKFNERLWKQIRSDRNLNNYDFLNPKGLSTALSRPYATKSPFNGTMISRLEVSRGLLRRGVFDLTMDSGRDRYTFIQFGSYSGGLSAFASSMTSMEADEENEDVDDDTANAGMEVTMHGSYFRPLEFFRGQGELMGHIWSGTASEPTTVLIVNSQTLDHQETFQLHNGATVSIDVKGSISLDLNGAVQFSLWNRNSQAQIKQSVGVFLKGKILVNAGFVTLDLEFNADKEPKSDLNIDVDFSSGNLQCIQPYLLHDVFRYEIQKNQKIPEIKHHVRTTRKLKYNVIGSTLYLNKINNEMCNKISLLQ